MDSSPPITVREFRERIVAICGGRGGPGLPRKVRDRHILLRAAVQSLDESATHSERELTDVLKTWLDDVGAGELVDHVALRRYLVDAGYLERDRGGTTYRVIPSGRGEVPFAADVRGLDAAAVIRTAREEAARKKRERSSRGPVTHGPDSAGDPQDAGLFSVRDRELARDRVLEWAASDPRVVAGAVVGSLARDEGDRWSDLDLTFAVVDGLPVRDVLEDWTHRMEGELDAVQLFDVVAGPTIYRVFLLPGCLQFDLSFTPAGEFAARGPKFRLLFGIAVERPHVQPPPAHELFGYAVHHALRARFCIERGRYWQAEYWVSGVRDQALRLACRRRSLPALHGRGLDDLPADVLDGFRDTLARSLDREELLRALGCAVAGLLRETDEVRELADRVEPALRTLTAAVGASGSPC